LPIEFYQTTTIQPHVSTQQSFAAITVQRDLIELDVDTLINSLSLEEKIELLSG
jgi:hypothetical protein